MGLFGSESLSPGVVLPWIQHRLLHHASIPQESHFSPSSHLPRLPILSDFNHVKVIVLETYFTPGFITGVLFVYMYMCIYTYVCVCVSLKLSIKLII